MNVFSHASLQIDADDYLELMDLFARYAWALDTGDIDTLMGFFTEQPWIEDPPQGRLEGRDGVRQFLWKVIDRPIHHNRQHVVQPRVVHGGPERCEVVSFWAVSELKGEAAAHARRGFYTDQCVKVNGRWLFESRFVRYWLPESLPWFAT